MLTKPSNNAITLTLSLSKAFYEPINEFFSSLGEIKTKAVKSSGLPIPERRFSEPPFKFRGGDNDKSQMLLYVTTDYISKLKNKDPKLQTILKDKVDNFSLEEFKEVLAAYYRELLSIPKDDYIYLYTLVAPKSMDLYKLYAVYLDLLAKYLDMNKAADQEKKLFQSLAPYIKADIDKISTYLSIYSHYHATRVGLDISSLSSNEQIIIGQLLSYPENPLLALRPLSSKQMIILDDLSYEEVANFLTTHFHGYFEKKLYHLDRAIAFLQQMAAGGLHSNVILKSTQTSTINKLVDNLKQLQDTCKVQLTYIEKDLRLLKKLSLEDDISLILSSNEQGEYSRTILTSPKVKKEIVPFETRKELLQDIPKKIYSTPHPIIDTKDESTVKQETLSTIESKEFFTLNNQLNTFTFGEVGEEVLKKSEVVQKSQNIGEISKSLSDDEIVAYKGSLLAKSENLFRNYSKAYQAFNQPMKISKDVHVLNYKDERLSFYKDYPLATFDLGSKMISCYIESSLKKEILQEKPAFIDRIQTAIRKGLVKQCGTVGIKILEDLKTGEELKIGDNYIVEVKTLGKAKLSQYNIGDCRFIGTLNLKAGLMVILELALGHNTVNAIAHKIMENLQAEKCRSKQV